MKLIDEVRARAPAAYRARGVDVPEVTAANARLLRKRASEDNASTASVAMAMEAPKKR